MYIHVNSLSRSFLAAGPKEVVAVVSLPLAARKPKLYIYIYIYIYIHTYIHTYTYVCIYIYIYIMFPYSSPALYRLEGATFASPFAANRNYNGGPHRKPPTPAFGHLSKSNSMKA